MKFSKFLVASALFVGATATNTHAQIAPISFGDAQSFSVLASSTVTNTGNSKVSCNVGTSPGTSIVAFNYPAVQIDGEITLGDQESATPLAAKAQVSAHQLYTDLSNRTSPVAVDLTTRSFVNSTTLTPGIYTFSSSALLGQELILDDSSDPNAIFIFKTGSTLITQTYSNVKMKSGGRGRNVFWLIGSSATIETYANIVGTIIATASITIKTGASSTGKLFALGAAVTMDYDKVDLGNIDCSGTVAALDTDGDGVPDKDDDYPNDPKKAWNNYSSTGAGSTIAFEDLWPYMGDYDLNDMTVSYKYNVITNAQNVVVKVIGNYTLNAAGGVQKDGFGVQFPIAASKVSNLQSSVAGSTFEAGQSNAVLILFTDMHVQLSNWNTFAGQSAPATNYVVSYDVTDGPLLKDFGLNYNPFLLHTENGSRREVHLPGQAATMLADKTLFGTGDDATSSTSGSSYLTKTGLPFAIELPTATFNYPMETIDITKAFLHFADWAKSGGTLFKDWYSNTTDPGYRNPPMIWTK